MDGMSAFEKAVKGSLEPYEVPYNSADWNQLEQRLDGQNASSRVSRAGLYALLLGGSMAIASSFILLDPPPVPQEAGAGVAMVQPSDPIPLAQEGQTPAPRTVEVKPEVVIPSSSTGTRAQDEAKESLVVEDRPEHSLGTQDEATPVKTAPPSTEPMVKPSLTEGCPGTLIEFTAENVAEEGSYLWNFGDGSFSTKTAPNHAFSKAGTFQVMLSHSSQGGGTIQNKPAADRIVIHEAPEASFNTLKQEYDNTVPSVHFENRSLGGRTYHWDFGDGQTSIIAHPDHVYKKQGVYTVTLTVKNAQGCEDRMERTVRIDSDYDLLSPKAFSPNGDGVDDVFMPEALKTLGVKFNLSIFGPDGRLVYDTNDAQRPWNGRMSNRGETCSAGDYVWMVEMKDGEKLGGTYNGSLQLVR